MQKAIEDFEKRFSPIITIVYEGESFTVAKAILQFNGRVFSAEGIARRSHKDLPNGITGQEIASGRALKALVKKFMGKKIHHRFMG